MNETKGMTKVAIQDDDGDIETLWATHLTGHHYRLENSPFYAYGVSWEDTIEALPESDGLLLMQHVVAKSGNRTVRVLFESFSAKSPEAKPILDNIVELGCSYEGAYSKLIVINVPPEIPLQSITDYLCTTDLDWEYADPTYEDLFGDS